MSKTILNARSLVVALGLAAVAATGTVAHAGVIVVSAKDDIFEAGVSTAPTGTVPGTGGTFFVKQTGGLFGNTNPGGGLLPSTVMVEGTITISATSDGVSCGSGCAVNNMGADGSSQWSMATTTTVGPGDQGIAPYTVTSFTGFEMGLVGVWGNGVTVDPTPFLIGSGGTFTAPAGFDILYLGTVDSFGGSKFAGTYNDNQGAFDVMVTEVPEPASWALMLLGFVGLGFAGFRRTKLAPIA